MLCPKCGSEIKEQMLYCSVCGEEIKFVPDYDAAVDDNIQLSITGVIEQLDMEESEKAPTRELILSTPDDTKEIIRHPKISNDAHALRIKKRYIAIIACALVGIIFIALTGAFFLNRYYSFDYQYEKALEEYDNSQYEQSIKTIHHAISLNASVPKIKLLLADNYIELNKYDEALAVLYDLLTQYPDDVNIYNKIAKIYEEKGDSESISLLVERTDIDSFKDSYSQYKKPSLTFSLPSGQYDDEIRVSIECDDECDVYYTLDGSKADNTKLLYTEPVLLSDGENTIKAVCYSKNGVMSDEISGTYVIEFAVPDMPSPSVQSGEYTEPKLISLISGSITDSPDAIGDVDAPDSFISEYKCYYTIDGDDPTADDNLYEAPIAMYIGHHVYKFVAISDKGVSSEVYNLDVTLNIVNLVDMGTAKANLELWLDSHGLNSKGATYKCEQAYIDSGFTYYIINEYTGDDKTGTSYAADVLTGMLYRARRDMDTGEYTLEPVIKPL